MNDPDRRVVVAGRWTVDLWRGWLRSEIRVWKDVRPALGGLLARKTCWNRNADRVFDEIVATVTRIWETT